MARAGICVGAPSAASAVPVRRLARCWPPYLQYRQAQDHDLWLEGTEALTTDENLAPVPGGASATGWMLYLPAPDPLADVVRSIVAGSAHLNIGQPPTGATAKTAAMTEAPGLVDLAALARRKADR